MKFFSILLMTASGLIAASTDRDLPEGLPRLPFHLTARPWQPLNIRGNDYLDALEGLCRYLARHQDDRGAIIDPIKHHEIQYSTPYFAFAVGTLVHAGRANDLLENGIRAMNHATDGFSKGRSHIPDQHGEFFIAALAGAIEQYEGHAPVEKLNSWRDKTRTPVEQVIGKLTNNWRAYAMKGEWMRVNLGLADRTRAHAFIEDAWLHAKQKERIADDKWHLYHDSGTDPESHAVECVGRGNLLGLLASGYDGPSAADMRKFVEHGTMTSLLLQDPSGQCPPNGRADDHVWNDVLYLLCFEVMAERAKQSGDMELAGQYRRAAMLSFQSIKRWQRTDEPWKGSYSITKNHFDPAQRVGYQRASNYSNYSGTVAMHLAEAFLSRKSEIPAKPAPVEIGGYAFTMDEKFGSAVANAGGMQMFVALRGQADKSFDSYWTVLGVERFARPGWDSRLGPSDGARDIETGHGVSFAPTWQENGAWVRMAGVPDRYHGKFTVQFSHPLLVRCAIDYTARDGAGPSFRQDFTITPDGVLATLRATGTADFGVTLPLLEDDGAPLRVNVTGRIASTSFNGATDEQNFLALDPGSMLIRETERIQSTYGWLRPVRAHAVNGVSHILVYPRDAGDPAAEKVLESFRVTDDGFQSVVGSVHGTLYTGRISAGGEGTSIDCDGDGKPDATFDVSCCFVLQLRNGNIMAVEADRKTNVTIGGKRIPLIPYTPAMVAAQ